MKYSLRTSCLYNEMSSFLSSMIERTPYLFIATIVYYIKHSNQLVYYFKM